MRTSLKANTTRKYLKISGLTWIVQFSWWNLCYEVWLEARKWDWFPSVGVELRFDNKLTVSSKAELHMMACMFFLLNLNLFSSHTFAMFVLWFFPQWSNFISPHIAVRRGERTEFLHLRPKSESIKKATTITVNAVREPSESINWT